MKITALKYQSLADLVLQETGSTDGLVAFALANGKNITYIPEAGEEFNVPKGLPGNRDIKNYYEAREIKPVSGVARITGAAQQFIESGFVQFGFTD